MNKSEAWLKEIAELLAVKEYKGAADMQERCAQLADQEMNGKHLAKAIRELKLPGDKP